MKSVAQDEVRSGIAGSQEGSEGACDLAWAVSKRLKLEGRACQRPGAPPSGGRGGVSER